MHCPTGLTSNTLSLINSAARQFEYIVWTCRCHCVVGDICGRMSYEMTAVDCRRRSGAIQASLWCPNVLNDLTQSTLSCSAWSGNTFRGILFGVNTFPSIPFACRRPSHRILKNLTTVLEQFRVI